MDDSCYEDKWTFNHFPIIICITHIHKDIIPCCSRIPSSIHAFTHSSMQVAPAEYGCFHCSHFGYTSTHTHTSCRYLTNWRDTFHSSQSLTFTHLPLPAALAQVYYTPVLRTCEFSCPLITAYLCPSRLTPIPGNTLVTLFSVCHFAAQWLAAEKTRFHVIRSIQRLLNTELFRLMSLSIRLP